MSTSNQKRLPKGIPVTPLLVVFLSCSCCFAAFWLPQWINDWQLARFAENLYTLPLPPETEVVDRNAAVGLVGNGNHCDFSASQTLVTELTRDQIEQYYKDVTLPPVNGNNEGKAQQARGQPIHVALRFEDKLLSDGRMMFTIALYDHGYNAGFDIRCR